MKKLFRSLLIAGIWIAVWLTAAALTDSQILLPSPLEAARALFRLLGTVEFYRSVLWSVGRISLGFLAGSLLGILLGTLTYRFAFLKSLFSPILHIIKATPVASFIVLLFVWFSNGLVASVTSVLIVLPVLWSSTFSALSEVDSSLLEMATAFRVPKRRIVRELYLPAILPYLKGALATAMGLAWKAGIAAEVICSPKSSIGGGIYESKIYLDTPSLFAWTLTVILVSVLLEKLVLRLMAEKKEGKA